MAFYSEKRNNIIVLRTGIIEEAQNDDRVLNFIFIYNYYDNRFVSHLKEENEISVTLDNIPKIEGTFLFGKTVNEGNINVFVYQYFVNPSDKEETNFFYIGLHITSHIK